MKALTIHQPWAQLIALGAKTIETRSWSTRYRGPIAIHAGISQKFIGIDYWSRLGQETGAAIHQALLDGGFGPSPAFPPYPKPGPDTIVGLPLGAIVATATLVDVVPMVAEGELVEHSRRRKDRGPVIAVSRTGQYVTGFTWANTISPGRYVDKDWTEQVITPNVPYGDFAPGRFAWILDDIQPCEPIPAKGRQGLWEWTP